jgi:hypothetical protein
MEVSYTIFDTLSTHYQKISGGFLQIVTGRNTINKKTKSPHDGGGKADVKANGRLYTHSRQSGRGSFNAAYRT